MSSKLYFRYGSMGSSKTANALMVQFNYAERGQKALFLKPQIDIRDGSGIVKSRIGLSAPCESIEKYTKDKESSYLYLKGTYDCIIVDEAQFLSEDDVKFLEHIVDYCDVPVICYGLRADFQGKLFPGSAALLASADKIEELKTICWCGKKATCNARYNEDGIVTEGNQVELGSNDKYVAVCRKHFHEGKLHGDEPCCDDAEAIEFKRQLNLWRQFYLTFNDDNTVHCENALFNAHFATAENVKVANYAWVSEILSRKTTVAEMLKAMPSAKEFITRY